MILAINGSEAMNLEKEPMTHTSEETTEKVGAPQEPESTPEGGESQNAQADDKQARKRLMFCWIGVALTILAWVMLMFEPWTSLAMAVAAIVCSALGVKSRRRDLAITMIIAAADLVLVYIVFWTAVWILI